VEDDNLDRYLISHAFGRIERSFEYEFATDAEEALERLSSGHPPSIIVTDLNMPGMGGMEFISQVKSSERLRHIPTIVFSTSSDQSDMKNAYDRYANSYVVKPDSNDGYIRFAERLNSYWMGENRNLC
jgi:CheY-like chemotaxis protein